MSLRFFCKVDFYFLLPFFFGASPSTMLMFSLSIFFPSSPLCFFTFFFGFVISSLFLVIVHIWCRVRENGEGCEARDGVERPRNGDRGGIEGGPIDEGEGLVV